MDTSPVADYLSLLRLDGRLFVVLGAGNGIGRQTAHALAQAGAQVVCVDRELDLAEAVAREVGGAPAVGDVTRRAEMERIFSEAGRLGPVRGLVDVVGMPKMGRLLDLDDAGWQWQLDMVLNHALLAVQVGGRAIVEAGGGAMAFVGSMSGTTTLVGQAAYGTAKAALHQLVAGAARELGAQKVRVNAVAPGFARTPRLNSMFDESQWADIGRCIPLGSAAVPSEIAGPLLFLVSNLASHVTGQTLAVDGGLAHTIAIPPLW